MPQATRDITRRIKSVKNTKKITKAMELVAAAKMRKSVNKVLSTRAYSDLSWEIVLRLVKKVNTSHHPFFQEKKIVKNVAVLVVSSNRGLCGSFNTQLVQKVVDSIRLHHPETVRTDVVSFGTKGRNEMHRRGLKVIADFAKADVTTDIGDITAMTKMLVKDFMAGKYDKVFVAYTDFVSSLRQVPHVKQLLPIIPNIDTRLGHIIHEKDKITEVNLDKVSEFIFEPDTRSLLDAFLPRLLEIQVFQAVLESEASEHSARMFAMRNASDAAGEMIDSLTLAYNQARQAGITAEIAEISAGSAALE